jgi:hypothetical protein
MENKSIKRTNDLSRRLALTTRSVPAILDSAKKRKTMDVLERMTKRVGISMARGIAAAQPQAATGVLAPMALAMIAWEVYDACQQIKDLDELRQINLGKDLISEKGDDQDTCGMSRSELVTAFTGKDAAFEECVKSRIQSGEADPPECQNYPIELPHKMAPVSEGISLDLPHKQ